MSSKSALLGILEAILQTEERNKPSLEIIERIQMKLYFVETQNSKKRDNNQYILFNNNFKY